MTRFICRSCKKEVEVKELNQSSLTSGYFAECPLCGAENVIAKKRKIEMDCFSEVYWWEEEDVSISNS